MARAALRGILSHKARLLSTMLAVMLGVAMISGTLVLTDTLSRTFDDLFADVFEDTDAVVREQAAFEGPNQTGDQRGRVPASLIATVESVDGVALAEGNVQGYTQIVGRDGDPIGDPEMGAPTFGGNWSESDELNPFALVDGRAPQAEGEVVIDKKSADDGELRVGDTTTVLVQGPPQQVEVVGIVKFGDADSPGGASFALFTTDVAQRLIAEPGMFDSISVLADDGVTQPVLAERIAQVTPEGVEVLTGAEITKESQDDIQESLSFFKIFMIVFAIVALLVGSFMIFNTFSITVAQRTRENALLRAIGASRRQVLGAVLFEAFIVGLVASLIGLAVGLLVAAGLKALLAGFGIDLPSGGVVFTSRTVVISLLAGMVVTMVAAWSPARRAAKVPPVAAMRATDVGSSGYGSKLRMLVGLGVVALGVVSLLGGLFGGGDNPLPLVALGALLVFFGVSVLGRTVALPLSRAIGAPLPRVRGVSGKLARQNAMRNPKRTAATASALMIGVGLVGFITTLAASTRASIDASIDEAFIGDLVVDSGTMASGGLDPAFAQQVALLPEVAETAGLRYGAAEVDGDVMALTGVDLAGTSSLIDVEPLRGSPDDLDDRSIAMFDEEADDKGLELGDTVPVLFKDSGPQEMTLGLVYGEDALVGRAFLGLAAYEANFVDQYDFSVYVKGAPGVPLDELSAAVGGIAQDYPGAEVLDRDEYKAEQSQFVDRLLGLVYALLGLAILIALLGIANTLALSVLERTRELGVLRAVGMSRAQLRSTVRWESVIIALQGTLLGLLIGLFFGWALVTALADEGVERLAIPWTSLVVVIALAGLAGVLAAVLPARRAAKLDVLRAIVTE
jgi:putative ABC transport system permease protein